MEYLERGDEAAELAGAEKVLGLLGAPSLLALRVQKGLHQEQSARREPRDQVTHPVTVKIIEDENRIKNTEVGPRPREVGHPALDGHPEAGGEGPAGGERRLVAVEQRHGAAEGRGEDAMAAAAGGDVEHPHAGANPVSVPAEPGAGLGERRAGGHGHGRSSRRAGLDRLAGAPADLLVIGGGITGAGVARDAAMRGLRTILVERGDLAAGTSSRSSRLVHGGLRYLEQRRLGLVFEALRERRTLQRIAPHLVRPLEFVFPLHEDDRLPPWKLAAGLIAYDLLAQFRNVGRPRVLGKRRLLEAEPMLRDRGLAGGASYYDAQCDDARLVVATARSAIDHGALVSTYTAVRSLVLRDGRVSGAEVEDVRSGARGFIEAGVVVNATGPWGDAVRRLEDPAAAPLLRPTKGTHVVVERDRIGHRHAITFLSPVDGRVMFVLPWGDLSYIGTTDTDYAGSADDVRATESDVVYLLRSVNARFPGARLALDDVRATWAGLRPLLAGGGSESSVSREHAIVEGPKGMLSVAGGKLTTYRSMAAEIVDRAAAKLGRGRTRPATDRDPLPGGEASDLETFRERGHGLGLPAATVTHILSHYGTESAGIFNLGTNDRTLLEPLHPAHPAVRGEVIHAVRRELAQTVADVLVRRIHLFYETRDHGVRCAPRVAALLGRELGWGAERVAEEAAAYAGFVGREAAAPA